MQNHAHPNEHNNGSNHIGWVVLFNSAITVAEYIGGVISGSLALISDAGHNFSDVLSLALSYSGEVLSRKKPTKLHSFGLKRAEVAVAVINAVSLCSLGVIIIAEAIRRFGHQQEISLKVMLPVAIMGLAGNFLSVLILRKHQGQEPQYSVSLSSSVLRCPILCLCHRCFYHHRIYPLVRH